MTAGKNASTKKYINGSKKSQTAKGTNTSAFDNNKNITYTTS